MSKLQDYYRLFDMFSGKLNEEQKHVLEGLEDQIIAEEILPAISESVAPVLGALRRPLALVVDYDPAGGITVKTTRGEVVVKEHTAKKYQLSGTDKVVKVAEAEQSYTKDKPKLTRKPATGLCVWISSSEFIQESKSSLTMAKAIMTADVKKVAELKLPMAGAYLVMKEKHPRYFREQQVLTDGYLLNTHTSTIQKQRQLERISRELNLGWKIEIVK